MNVFEKYGDKGEITMSVNELFNRALKDEEKEQYYRLLEYQMNLRHNIEIFANNVIFNYEDGVNDFIKFLKKHYELNCSFAEELLKIKEHLKAMHLSSIDLHFLRKIKRITMEKIKYDDHPFCLIETVDGETYFFSYKPAQNKNYCTCSEDDLGYQLEYDCCGIHCDWYSPVITKFHPGNKEVTQYTYQGLQKTIWQS